MATAKTPQHFRLSILGLCALLFTTACLAGEPHISENVFKYHRPENSDIKLELASPGNTGALVYNYPIGIPPARGGFVPQVALQYSSHASNGPLGMGWAITLPFIQRRIEDGGLDYSAEDFVYGNGHSTRELVFVGLNSQFGGTYKEFRFQLEDESALRFFLDETDPATVAVWRMLNKDHTWTTFGEEVADQLRGTASGGQERIYRWCISRQTDTHGNVISYAYDYRDVNTGETLYPTYIYYNNNYNRIRFEWCSGACRPDVRADYGSGFRLITSKRLNSIVSEIMDLSLQTYDVAYQYDFEYDIDGSTAVSEATDHTLLKSITQSGAGQTTLPPTTFAYTGELDDRPLTRFSVVPLSSSFAGYNPFSGPDPYERYFAADFSGDGRDDVLHIMDEHHVAVWLGRADGLVDVQPPIYFSNSLAGTTLGQGYGWIFRIGDFNGDGMKDVFHVRSKTQANIWLAKRNAAGAFDGFDIRQFTGPPPYCECDCACEGSPICFPDDPRNPLNATELRYAIQIGDFNGDGKDDYLTFYEQVNTSCLHEGSLPGDPLMGRILIYFSINGWQFDLREFTLEDAWGGYDFSLPARDQVDPQCDTVPHVDPGLNRQYGAVAADVNNDGLADIVHPKCAEGILVVFLNRGLVDSPEDNTDIDFQISRCPASGTYNFPFGPLTQENPVRFQFGDFNGDSVLDLLNIRDSDVWTGDEHILINRNSWYTSDAQFEVYQPLGQLVHPELAEYIFSADFDADRSTDLVLVYETPHPPNPDPDIFLYRSLGDGIHFGTPDSEDGGTPGDTSNQYNVSNIYPDVNGHHDEAIIGDFTGDGRTDILNLFPSDLARTVMIASNAPPPDLLTKIGRGSETTAEVDYAAAAAFAEARLPFALPVVKEIRRYDLGATSSGLEVDVSTFSYKDGVYDKAEMKFLGFGEVTEFRPLDHAVKTEYITALDYEGRVESVRYLHSGTVLREVINEWQIDEATYPKFPHLHSSVDRVIGPTDVVESSVVYTYDPVHHGVTTIVRSGEDVETLTETYTWVDVLEEYGGPDDHWLWRIIYQSKADSPNGILRYTQTIYALTGKPSWVVESVEQSSSQNTGYTWTSEGNIATVDRQYDPDESYVYEETLTYPETVTYSGSSGPLWNEEYAFDRRFGTPESVVDKNGVLHRYTYDDFGRKLDSETYAGSTIQTPMVALERRLYDDAALPTSVKIRTLYAGTSEFVDLLEYRDARGRVVQETRVGEEIEEGVSNYQTTRHVFDEKYLRKYTYGPNLVSDDAFLSTPTGTPQLREQYDVLGRLVERQVLTGGHGVVAVVINLDGAESEIVDADGKWRRERVDGFGRVIEVAEMSASGTEFVTTYTRDGMGDLRGITDSGGQQYTWDYDRLGRVTVETHPDVGTRQYNWLANDELNYERDQDNYVIAYYRDGIGRPTLKTYTRTGETAHYTHRDEVATRSVDRMTAHWNTAARWGARDFDPLGNCLQDTVIIAGGSGPAVQSYIYDKAGRLTGLTYPDGTPGTYAYFPGSNWLSEVVVGSGSQAIRAAYREYSPSGVAQTIEYFVGGSGSPVVTVTRDISAADGRLYSLRVTNPASTGDPADDVLNEVYTYTPAGDIDATIDKKKGAQLGLPGDNYVIDYQYDNLHRLTHVYVTGNSTPAKTMVYDNQGRLLENWSYKRKVALTYGGPRPHAPQTITIGSFACPIAYDTRANMITFDGAGAVGQSITGRDASYNAANRLANLTYEIPGVGTFTESYLYDANKLRVRKDRHDGSSIFYYTPQYVVAHGTPIKYVVVGDSPVADIRNGEIRVYVYDRLGSVRALCDASGVVVFASDYDVWGVAEDVQQGSSPAPIRRYTGAERDGEVYLYNLKNREYDPVYGIFVAGDELNQAPLDPQQLNPYAYARNSPANSVDRNGRYPAHMAPEYYEQRMQWLEAHPEEAREQMVIGAAIVGTVAAVATVELWGPPVVAGAITMGQVILNRGGPWIGRIGEVFGRVGNRRSVEVIELTAKSGQKLAQQIGRWREIGGKGGMDEFLEHAGRLAAEARAAGNEAIGYTSRYGADPEAVTSIFRRGGEYLVVQGNRILSYVSQTYPGGIVDEYRRLGGGQ